MLLWIIIIIEVDILLIISRKMVEKMLMNLSTIYTHNVDKLISKFSLTKLSYFYIMVKLI